ncbi:MULTISPECIES: type IV pilus modification protein PilV [Gammaproteobacteria]|uniref:type IV pilus modification protein PilV n=1 Tax=Gammaproteobacteria TaxID=1236 RepID=UPI003A958CC9
MKISEQSGYGLIEVLVAVLVLAIGLLGLAGLQTQSLRFNNEAYFRTQATLLAMDMADRLRSNREAARVNSGSYTFTKTESVPTSGTDCTSAPCSPTELAQYDFKVWKERALTILPSAKVALTPEAVGTATPWQEYAIEIEYSSSENAATQLFQYRVKI